jgi:hypothetical protein
MNKARMLLWPAEKEQSAGPVKYAAVLFVSVNYALVK